MTRHTGVKNTLGAQPPLSEPDYAHKTFPVYDMNKQGRVFADKNLVSLFYSIEAALPELTSRVVQLTSCYIGEGTRTVGQELSVVATYVLESSALYIEFEDTGERQQQGKKHLPSLLDVVKGRAQIDEVIRTSAPNDLPAFASATLGGSAEEIFMHVEKFKHLLLLLRNDYKLIILCTPNIMTNSMASRLSTLADGTVLVLEAERTRSPVAQQALLELKRGDAKIIGAIFNKRRYHIPAWIYRLLWARRRSGWTRA